MMQAAGLLRICQRAKVEILDHLDGMQLAAREMVSPIKLNELDHKP